MSTIAVVIQGESMFGNSLCPKSTVGIQIERAANVSWISRVKVGRRISFFMAGLDPDSWGRHHECCALCDQLFWEAMALRQGHQ